MRSSVTATFTEPDAFRAAMRSDGMLGYATTRQGQFRARLAQIALDRLRLSVIQESLSRIAYMKVPKDLVLLSASLDQQSRQIWGGIRTTADDVVTLGPGTSAHARTDGPCHWTVIWLPAKQLAHYSRALTGTAKVIPASICVWRLTPSAGAALRQILTRTTRAARGRLEAFATVEAAHGLEQQLIQILVECLAGDPLSGGTAIRRRQHELMAQFEAHLTRKSRNDASMTLISEALGVTERFLRRCCKEQLGMGPLDYLRLRRLQSVHRALRQASAQRLGVWDTASRHGFRDQGRFVTAYRDIFGEHPSTTLRRGPHRMPELLLRRQSRRKIRH